MKTSRCAAIVLASLVLTPAGAAETSAQDREANATLGRLDAALEVCAEVDKEHAAAYREYRKNFISFGDGGQRVEVEASKTNEFREAYQKAMADFREHPPARLAKECAHMIGV